MESDANFSLASALSEMDSYILPEAVDPAVFCQLKAALRKALIARSEGKLTRTPPGGTGNAVPDLDMADAGGGTVNLTWHYYNLGDYNQDGTVGIADITPLAMHFGQGWVAGEENTLPCVVDGSGDGTVNIADVTPIAMNYGAEVANYRIENATAPGGTYSLTQQIPMSSALDVGTQRAHFLLNFTPTNYTWYRVVPADSSSATGDASNEVLAMPSLWVHTWGGINADGTTGIAVDPYGNIYLAGYTNSSGSGGSDVLLLKYTPYGDLVWARTWGGPELDAANAVCYDDVSGNVLLTGLTRSFGAGLADVILLSFDADGTLVMQKAWGGANNDFGYSVKTFDGDIYLAGGTKSTGAGDFDTFILKLAPSGDVIWQKTWGGALFEETASIAVDSYGNPVMAGMTNSFGQGAMDVFTIMYDSSGNLLRQSTWGTASPEQAISAVIDGDDNLYVAGSGGGGSGDALIIKYTPAGSFDWAELYGGVNIDIASAVAIDSFGNPYIYGGTTSTSLGGSDLFVAAFSADGSILAQTAWGTSSAEEAMGALVGEDGFFYGTGTTVNTHGAFVDPGFGVLPASGMPTAPLATETIPVYLMNDIPGIPQAPVSAVLDQGGGDTDAMAIKVMLLS